MSVLLPQTSVIHNVSLHLSDRLFWLHNHYRLFLFLNLHRQLLNGTDGIRIWILMSHNVYFFFFFSHLLSFTSFCLYPSSIKLAIFLKFRQPLFPCISYFSLNNIMVLCYTEINTGEHVICMFLLLLRRELLHYERRIITRTNTDRSSCYNG